MSEPKPAPVEPTINSYSPKLSSNSSAPDNPAANTATQPMGLSEDRSDLLARARSFLQSPSIVHQDIMAKRQFLAEKGLDNLEIQGLLRELVSAFAHSFLFGLTQEP